MSKGIPESEIHITQGQHANPFLQNALHENVDKIKQTVKQYVEDKL